MSMSECGPAAVVVYVNGARDCVLKHDHDGGEAYMGPVLRHAVKYAKTHYDDGNIVAVLCSEPEMREIPAAEVMAKNGSRYNHVYYVSWRWDAESARKNYEVYAWHTNGKTQPQLPESFAGIPKKARKLV